MKKLRFIKVVVPEIVAFHGDNYTDLPHMEIDYRCPNCGQGAAREFECCPYCKAEFAWNKVRVPLLDKFSCHTYPIYGLGYSYEEIEYRRIMPD